MYHGICIVWDSEDSWRGKKGVEREKLLRTICKKGQHLRIVLMLHKSSTLSTKFRLEAIKYLIFGA